MFFSSRIEELCIKFAFSSPQWWYLVKNMVATEYDVASLVANMFYGKNPG